VQVRRALREAVAISGAPSVIRFSKGNPPAPIKAVRVTGQVDILRDPDPDGNGVDVLVVGLGAMASVALTAAAKLEAQGFAVRVVDPRWALPVSAGLVDLARDARAVAVIEDNLVIGGVGSQIAQALRDGGLDVPVHLYGIPKAFLGHGSRGEVLEEAGLTPEAVADRLSEALRA
ncbi:MAG TPA: transketolase C-terminal domain-containing protein, partial [Candidatus Lustribacter sp.]|nr:transketolase C-terminal domain-containing protein [Candidatus Lustribacter sp.]